MQEVPFPNANELDSIGSVAGDDEEFRRTTRIFVTKVNNVDYIAPYSEMQLRRVNPMFLTFEPTIEVLAKKYLEEEIARGEIPPSLEEAKYLLREDLFTFARSRSTNFQYLTYHDIEEMAHRSPNLWYTVWLNLWLPCAKPEFAAKASTISRA
jgi:hypothetical protein